MIALKAIAFMEVAEVGERLLQAVLAKLPPVDHTTRESSPRALIARGVLITAMTLSLVTDIMLARIARPTFIVGRFRA